MSEPKTNNHLDLLGLDAVRAGEASLAEKAHVEACGTCQAALQDLRQLSGELEGAYGDLRNVPPGRDRAILEMAQRELDRIKVRRLVRPRLWWSAAAAVLLVAAGIAFWLGPGRDLRDIDRSGAVDIVDAYALAVRIRSGAPLDPSLDFNHDGVVDWNDAGEVAKESVSLARRTR